MGARSLSAFSFATDFVTLYYRKERAALPIGTAVSERTFELCKSLNYREWSGFYTVSGYETQHEHEYNASRNASAPIDISALFKYLVTGKHATRLVSRTTTPHMTKVTGAPV